MKALITIGFVILMMSRHCKDVDNTEAAKNITVPEYSETGANTFGAYVNNQVWINFGQHWHSTEIGGSYQDNVLGIYLDGSGTSTVKLSVSGELTITQKGYDQRDESLSFSITRKGKSFVGQYSLGQYGSSNLSNDLMSWNNWIITGGDYYTSLDRNPVQLIVKRDTVLNGKHIISGVFQGYLYKRNVDSVRVSGGVFDLTVTP